MAQKINDLPGLRNTLDEKPEIKKVHITTDGRHYFDEAHAKAANGYTSKKEEGKKTVHEAKKVEYKTFDRDAKELQLTAEAPTTPAA